MAGPHMPPMVASTDRFGDIQPYGDRLRASDPMKWGAIFPWEFPQNGTRQQEEDFLSNFFSSDDIHVQGGAGNVKTPGAGFRFLKQVWYTQALWNVEQRIPAVNDWWWKNAEAEGILNAAGIEKYILDPNVELKTFFASKELAMYGEKFLWHVVPLIQQTAKAKISDKIKTKTSDGSGVNDPIQPHGFRLASYQPRDAVPKMISLPGPHATAPSSAAARLARPHPANYFTQAPMEQPPLTCKRGLSSSGRYHGGGGIHIYTRPPAKPYNQLMHLADQDGYRSASGMQPGYDPYTHANPVGAHGVPLPKGRGQAFVDPHGPIASCQTQEQGGYPGTRVTPGPPDLAMHYGGQQPSIIWSSAPLVDRSNHGIRQTNRDVPEDRAGYRGGYGLERRGDRGPSAYTNDRGRGRGKNRGRSSFTNHDHRPAATDFFRQTSNDFYGPASASKARRGSVISVEKNWRSGSEHPQKDIDINEDSSLTRPKSRYVPPRNDMTFDPKLAFFSQVTTAQPCPMHDGDSGPQAPALSTQSEDQRYHCTQNSIGELCSYATKLAVFSVPAQLQEHEIANFFCQFGQVLNVWKKRVGMFRIPPPDAFADQLAIITFSSANEARTCLRNKPRTWLSDSRRLRVEVPKEYWDPSHKCYLTHRSVSASVDPPSGASFQTLDDPTSGAGGTHQFHDGLSTVRASARHPLVDAERQAGSEETTPTASGANTPRKKKQNNKNKNQNKQKQTSRVASLAESSTSNSELHLKSENSTVQQPLGGPDAISTVEDAVTEKPDLPVDTEKQRAGSTSTGIQAASELSVTPIDQITTKLPKPLSPDENLKPSTGVSDATTKADDRGSAAEPPAATINSADITLSTGNGGPGHLFRPHEAETKAPTSNSDSGLVNESEKMGGPKDGWTGFLAKADEEPIDDSFHTATASPGSSKKDMVESQDTDATPTEKAATISERNEDDNQTASDPQPSSTQLRAPENHDTADNSPSSAPLRIDAELATEAQKHEANESVSDGSSLKPTKPFITAPNTPVVEQDGETEASAQECAPATSKRVEKTKGPPQTESFSMFGKKQKKPKQEKQEKRKGTLKGMPKEVVTVSVGQAETHRVTNKPEAKNPGLVSTPLAEREQSTGRGRRNTANRPSQVGSADPPTNERQPDGPDGRSSGSARDTSTAKDKKPGGLFNAFKDYLAGAHGKGKSKKTQTGHISVPDPSLTDAKDPGTATGTEKSQSRPSGNREEDVADGFPTSKPSDDSVLEGLDDNIPTFANHVRQDDASNSGLGIVKVDLAIDSAEIKPNKKKKKPKNKNKTVVGSGDADNSLAQGSEFLFTFKANTSGFPNPGHSDTSSNTVGEATPPTGTSSPVTSKPPKRLPLNSPSSSNVVKGKEPMWKNKKRVYRTISGLEESGDEDTKDNYALDTVDSGNSATSGITLTVSAESVVDPSTGMQTPRTIVRLPRNIRILVLNPGSDDGGAGESTTTANGNTRDTVDYSESEAVRESKAKMQKLLEEESSRKHGRKGSRAGRPMESEKSRVDELSKLYPAARFCRLHLLTSQTKMTLCSWRELSCH